MPVALGNSLREAIRSARSGGRTVSYRKGKPAFAIVPAEDAEYMQKLEDELDNRLADEALAEDSEGVPIEILFQRYGIERE